MVEPEIDHHLFELALAVGRAKDLLLRELDQQLPLALHGFDLFRRAHRPLVGAVGVHRRIVGRLLLRAAPLHLSRDEVVLGELTRASRQRLEPGQAGRHRGVGNPLRLQLLFDVFGQADLADSLDVARGRAEADAVQHVEDGLVVGAGRDGIRHNRRGPAEA